MKNKLTLLAAALIFTSLNSQAQLAIGAGAGMLKSTEENSEALLGAELYGKYDVSDAFRVGVNLGVYSKSYEILGTKIRTSMLPISLSGEYLLLSDAFRPYVGLHAGMMRSSLSGGNNSTGESYFSVSPVVGAEYSISDNFGVNFNFKYGFTFYKNDLTEGSDNFSTFSPNLGVFYKL